MAVLLHGFGAPGDDLAHLWRILAVPREIRFVFPVGPHSFSMGFGESRAWWMVDVAQVEAQLAAGEMRDLSGGMPDGADEARSLLSSALDAVQERFAVPADKLVLGGFSQGAMLCCDLVLRTDRQVAGLVLLSGTLLAEQEWVPLMPRRRGLPVVQSHGTHDVLLPFSLAERLRDHLRSAGLQVDWVQFFGGHEIPGSVIDRLGAFISRFAANPAIPA